MRKRARGPRPLSCPSVCCTDLVSTRRPSVAHDPECRPPYTQSCNAQPALYGFATTYVHCDAGDISTEESRALASLVLVEGGTGFKLDNLGAGCGGDQARESHPNRSS